jgi:molybdopterin-containing oxidoreductase family iron-sulfur binding subunit
MSDDRHINFKLMRDRILALSETPGLAGEMEKNGGRDARGPRKYWRSLEEFVDAPEFREFVEREFPQQAEEWNNPLERRTFLKIMGASLALAGLSGCVYQPPEKIVPYVKQPEEEVPGKSLFFATAVTLGGIATPVLARSNEGRPTKIEGNPDHPNNRNSDPNDRGSSATDIFAQASVLALYDPDRSQTPTHLGETRPWSTFVGALREALNGKDGNGGQKAKQGAGLRFLTETVTSPTLAAQLKGILTTFSQAKWHQYEPANRDQARAGAVMAFGQPVNTIYDFSKADRILSIDADFLSAEPGNLRYARDYARRRGHSGTPHSVNTVKEDFGMSRLYVIETTPTLTGANADHRWTIKPSTLFDAVSGIAKRAAADKALPLASGNSLEAIADDLREHKGASIVVAGATAPPAIQALAHQMNAALGNVGKTVFYTDPVEANSVDQTQSLRELVQDIDAGKVEVLVIIGGNPLYNTPVDLKLNAERLGKVALRVHHGLYHDETAEYCHWHVPATHYLESWSDTRSYDGTVTIVQPLIEPLYDSRSDHELLALFSDQYDKKAYDLVREYWNVQRTQLSVGTGAGSPSPAAGAQAPGAAGQVSVAAGQASGAKPQASPATGGALSSATPAPATATGGDFESWWRKCVHDGFIPNTALPVKTFQPKAPTEGATNASAQAGSGGYELVFRTDPSIYDGQFANNGWLQELPKPLTKITWENVAHVSPKTAFDLYGIKGNGAGSKGREHYVPQIDITYGGRTLNSVPLWIQPGHADGVITIHLGYGREKAGTVGNEHGFDAYKLRTSDAPWSGSGAEVQKVSGQAMLATTQLHFNMEDYKFDKEDRDILRVKKLEEYLHEEPESPAEREEKEPPEEKTLYDPKLYDYKDQKNDLNYAWGMAIDLNNCTGCNACTIACQSENNIPVVGKDQVSRSREMHWIRVDAYFKGEPENPEGPYFQPVPCMHCENAPCEPVCPVHATVHSAEGLNDMVYNRCVGTKYCSNNCPYKVRRFNFFLYQDWEKPTYQLMRNPDVSVRSRGVMEKCTYCVQRIQSAKITSEIEGRKIRDGEIVTACQAVCPTEAIVFGNINDPESRVAKLKADHRDYSLLGELNTRPRTTYLTALRNPNPELEKKKG